MKLHITSETGRLRAVVLGLPISPGATPSLEETFDSKSYESVLHGVYPAEEDMVREMCAFEAILKKYDVDVYRMKMGVSVGAVASHSSSLAMSSSI